MFDDLYTLNMLLFTFMPNLVENGWKTKKVLQIQNPGNTTTLSDCDCIFTGKWKYDAPCQNSLFSISSQNVRVKSRNPNSQFA